MLAAPRIVAQCQPTPHTEWWIVDGPVRAVAVEGGVAYLGGEFTYAGPRTGPAAVFDPFFGLSVLRVPRIEGAVHAVEADGKGGWFLGGQFTRVGGYPQTNLVHLTRELVVDVGWDAGVVGTAVYALRGDGDRLYVGGQFTRIGGSAQRGLAAVQADDGVLVAWNPSLGGNVYTIAVADGIVYVGGTVNAVGSASRGNLAAVDAITAEATAWNPNADRAVNVLVVAEDSVYAGGQFTSIGGKPRNRLAALDRATGTATTWNPNPNGTVRALAVTPTTVLVGGDFTTISVQNRRGFAAVNRSNGAAQALDLQLEGAVDGLVTSLRLVGNIVYLGGSFHGVQGLEQPMLAAAELTTGLPSYVPLGTLYRGASDNAAVYCLGVSGDRILCGGAFESIGGQVRNRAAALSTATGALLEWDPAPTGPVHAVLAVGGAIYLGGVFAQAGGAACEGVAKVDMARGLAVGGWSVTLSNRYGAPLVRVLDAAGDRLLLGGQFDAVGGRAARFLGAVSLATGEPAAFDAALKGGADGLVGFTRSGDVLYVAGDFTSVGTQASPRLAALDVATGAVVPWLPAPNREVTALASAGGRLYVGGSFTRISGVDIRHLVCYDAVTRDLLPWDPALGTSSGGIAALACTDTVVYVAGNFDSIGGEFRAGVAALNPSTAQAYEWNPAPNAVPFAVRATDQFACLLGGFRTLAVDGARYPCGYLAAYDRGPRFTKYLPGAGKLQIETTTGDRTRTVLELSQDLRTWRASATNDNPGYRWSLEVPITGEGAGFLRARSE